MHCSRDRKLHRAVSQTNCSPRRVSLTWEGCRASYSLADSVADRTRLSLPPCSSLQVHTQQEALLMQIDPAMRCISWILSSAARLCRSNCTTNPQQIDNGVLELDGYSWSTCGPKLHREAEKRNHFSFVNKSFNMQCNLTNFSRPTLVVSEYYHRCYSSNFWNLH